jgi:hypothetical protein
LQLEIIKQYQLNTNIDNLILLFWKIPARMLVPKLVNNGFNSACHIRVNRCGPNSGWKLGTDPVIKMGIKTI